MTTKMRIIILLIAFLQWNGSEMMAQRNDTIGQPLDEVQLRLLYEVKKVAQKGREEIILIDTMALNVGAKWSEYYDWHKVKLDSQRVALSDKTGGVSILNDEELNARLEAGAEVYNQPRKPETMRIYKERGTNKVVTIDYGPFDYAEGAQTYLYFEEMLPEMKWEISSDTTTILDYVCMKATTSFRGRTYDVWFTLDIPVNDGPWKLYGLPGMIMKAETRDGIFKFKAIGLESIKEWAIAFPTDRKLVQAKSLKQVNDYRANSRKAVQVIIKNGGRLQSYTTGNPVKYFDFEKE